jgi:hypothetical protein
MIEGFLLIDAEIENEIQRLAYGHLPEENEQDIEMAEQIEQASQEVARTQGPEEQPSEYVCPICGFSLFCFGSLVKCQNQNCFGLELRKEGNFDLVRLIDQIKNVLLLHSQEHCANPSPQMQV